MHPSLCLTNLSKYVQLPGVLLRIKILKCDKETKANTNHPAFKNFHQYLHKSLQSALDLTDPDDFFFNFLLSVAANLHMFLVKI